MTSEGPGQRDWKSISIIGLAVLVVVLVGAIVGYIVSGGLSDDPSSELAGGSTTTSSFVVAPPPTTGAPVTTVATSQPPSSDPPGQLTIVASEDTYTDASDPQEVNGFDAVLELENDPPEVKQGLMRFDVAGIPEGVTIQQVALRLFINFPSASPIAVHLVEGEWNETETAAANAPPVGDRVGTIPAGGSQGEAVEIDLTEVVTAPGPIGFYLFATGEDTIELASRESGANGPALIVRWGQ